MRDWFNYTVLGKSSWMFWRELGGFLASGQMLHDHVRLARHCDNVLVDDLDPRSFRLNQQGACNVEQAPFLLVLHHRLLATDPESNLNLNSNEKAIPPALHNYLALHKLHTARHHSKHHPHPPDQVARQDSAAREIFS